MNTKKDLSELKTRLHKLPALSQKMAVIRAYDVSKLFNGKDRLIQFRRLLGENIAILEPLYNGVR